jgi:hypothetical protein
MNKKLQALVDEFSDELRRRYPGVRLDVSPRHRKSACIYITPPEESIWDGDGIWDIVEEMAPKQTDLLVETGYYILLIPNLRLKPADLAVMREQLARYEAGTPENERGVSHDPNT